MQTFVPYGADFYATARCLDDRRLGKQRVEAYQILRTLLNETQGWKNHPAIKMWYGYEQALVIYTQIMCGEWVARGYLDTVADKTTALAGEWFDGKLGLFEPFTNEYVTRGTPDTHVSVPYYWYPLWLNDPNLTNSHRSNLVHKYPEHYGNMWPIYLDHNKLEYVWPAVDTQWRRNNWIVKDIGQCERNPYLYDIKKETPA